MVMMILIHRQQRLLTVAVLIVVLCSNLVISEQKQQLKQQQEQQRLRRGANNVETGNVIEQQSANKWPAVITETNDTTKQQPDGEQQQQQQQLLLLQQIKNAAAAAINSTTAATVNNNTNNNNSEIIIQQSTTKATTTTTTTLTTTTLATLTNSTSTKSLRNGESVVSVAEQQNSTELADNNSEDVVEKSNLLSTTNRPMRSGVSVHNSAQERERKLMNVLAARRSALHRGGFRRAGTTGRTATLSANPETTSKSPTDARSICIRNCTKNFTRRTTASCMRQCANFTRVSSELASNANGSVAVKPLVKGNQTIEKDTNEILFTDESSHGLFVVAKEENSTANHIPDAIKILNKLRQRQKVEPVAFNVPPASLEDDDIQPYLYFGQKLPPLKPAMLAITSVSDEHPKLLEVSVAKTFSSTTPPSLTSTSTLSAVERSRSRYKYNHARGGIIPFSRRGSASARPLSSAAVEPATNETVKTKESLQTIAANGANGTTYVVLTRNPGARSTTTTTPTTTTTSSTTTSTTAMPTITPTAAQSVLISNTPLLINVLSEEEEAASTPASLTENITTTSATTTTAAKILPSIRTTTPSSAPKRFSTTITLLKTMPAIPTTTTSIAAKTTRKYKSIIEEETEMLRAMAPTLTREIKTNEKTNLIIFINRTSDVESTTKSAYSSTDAYSTILRTTVLSSVRSTVNPPAASNRNVTNQTSEQAYVGVVESDKNGNEISSTVLANEPDVSQEMRRINIATIVLACIGILPLIAVILYLVRNLILQRAAKHDGDFDVCITDQQPISPVKKLDGKYLHGEEDDDEVDHNMHHMHHSAQSKMHARDANHNHRYDEHGSVASQSDQEFDRSNIRLKSLLGEGNFGQVWKAEADDLTGHIGATRIVAVKTIRACSAQLSLKDEANIMRKLGSHPNVVTLLGACVDTEPHMLIMEYAMRGRLLSLLRAARSASNILPASVPGGRSLTPLSPRTMAGFALDIACGMEYIAEKRIVHRDLAARNVLLDHNGVCKICDFGMSLDLDAERKRKEQENNINNEIMRSNSNKFKFDFGSRFILNHWSNNFSAHNQSQAASDNEKRAHGNGHGHGQSPGHDTMSKRHALPIRWMAPEALQYHIFTTETDVWAFGIVLWEIATLGSTPYSQLTGREVIRRVPNGLRPEIPKEGRRDFYNLMVRCWHKEQQMRPTFTQARQEISRCLHKYVDDESASSDYMDVSGFSEDLEHGMVYFNHRISEFECEI